jgi:hypothetical protein
MKKDPKIRSIGKNLTAGVDNTIYTCPANFIAKMVLLFVSNHGGNNKIITIRWHDASTNEDYYIVGGYVLSANGFLKLDGSYLVLNPGDYMVVNAESGSTMSTTITVEEHYEQSLF